MEYSRRAVEKLATRKGVDFQDDRVVQSSDGDLIQVFPPEAYASKPEFWKAVGEFLQELPDTNQKAGKVAKSEVIQTIDPTQEYLPFPMPAEGPMSTSGFCQWPGLDGHGHATCSTQVGTKGCKCSCHQEGEES